MPDRRHILLQGLDVAAGSGIEIGALAWPIVSRADGNITYVDWADTETLRRKYADDPNVDVDRIVRVDAVWGDKTLAEAVGAGRKFDYVIASHVVEHVPDLIAWIGELLAVLGEAGEIRLAVPDKRYTFDCLRRETTLADIIAAHLYRARKPMAGQVLDFFINYIPVDLLGLWQGTVDVASLRPDPARLPLAVELARGAVAGDYHDVHCWVFSPVSFTRLMEQLVAGGWLDCRCAMFTDTARHQLEFFIGLTREPDREAAAASWRHAADALVAAGDRMAAGEALAAVEADRDLHAGRLKQVEGELARIRARLTAASERAAAAESRVAAMTRSRSWRYTAMLRQLKDRLTRR